MEIKILSYYPARKSALIAYGRISVKSLIDMTTDVNVNLCNLQKTQVINRCENSDISNILILELQMVIPI